MDTTFTCSPECEHPTLGAAHRREDCGAPRCLNPQHAHLLLVERAPDKMTKEQAWCGRWLDCTLCHYSRLEPSPDLEQQLAEQVGRRAAWQQEIIDAARAHLARDRSFAVVLLGANQPPEAAGTHRSFKKALRSAVGLGRERSCNAYVVARYGAKAVVYVGETTVLAERDDAFAASMS